MKWKSFWLRMIPVFLLVTVTAVMSLYIYSTMMASEEEICWQRLEVAINSTAGKISTRITDNFNFLTSMADSAALAQGLDDHKSIGAYLSSVMSKTVFDRMDIILPDNTIITQEGELSQRGGKSGFEHLKEKGVHVTGRLTSSFTGQEVVCCVAPIENSGNTVGILVGTLNCSTLSNIFEVFTFGQEAQLFLIDRTSGDYLMDNWHEDLGNIHDLGEREGIDGSTIDMVPAILNGESTRYAYYSQSNGEASYQYSAPVEGYDWTVCVVVQEDVVFANLRILEKNLMTAGLVTLNVILFYLIWNVLISITAIKNEEKVKRLEYEQAKNAGRAAFISNMSHDIRTPLNGIIGMLGIIKNHREDEATVNDCLGKIEVSAQYLSTLTSDMLDINEIENNKLVIPSEPVDLSKLAAELTFMMDKQARDVGVSYEIDLSHLSHPKVTGSAVHIKRILVNLIGNAIKYSKNAGKCVWVTFADEPISDDTGRKMYRFTVKDNGIGMSKEFQRNMYRAFEQELIGPRSEYQGYGLGLTIVHHLVKKMGGTIELESAQGVGSTFTVSIPFDLDQGVSDLPSCETSSADITGMRILLVEDNEFNMEIANTLLTDAGAAITTAANGKLALDAFAASAVGAFDAIIMDVMMPEMDGYDATKAIRAMDRDDAKSIPIIAMTASTFAEDVERCIASGMNAHVAKPIEMDKILKVLAELRH